MRLMPYALRLPRWPRCRGMGAGWPPWVRVVWGLASSIARSVERIPATGGRRYGVTAMGSTGRTIMSLRVIAGHRGTRATFDVGVSAGFSQVQVSARVFTPGRLREAPHQATHRFS